MHFNHQLRSQANEDEAFVRNLCDTHHIELIVQTECIHTLAKEQHSSIETCARNWRRVQFKALSESHQLTRVATGHHQNDNVETLLHRLQRGTAYRGLCGIRPSRALGNITLISPLLCVTRQNIRSYLHSLNQS